MDWFKQNWVKVVVAIVILVWAFQYYGGNNWIGFYYPNADDLTKNTQSSKLNSIEECRVWVNTQVSLYNPNREGYDYECGKNCRFDDGFYVCKKTIR